MTGEDSLNVLLPLHHTIEGEQAERGRDSRNRSTICDFELIYLIECKVMSVYLRKKDRIYSQKSTRDNYINVPNKKFRI